MTLPERIVSGTLVWTWAIYTFGGLYVAGPVLAWMLAGLVAISLYLGPALRRDLRPTGSVPVLVWIWILGMLLMLVALWVGHFNWGL
ncbi:MAG: O-antigen ligase domain-containing protein, partial [Boseongicola sp.]|nr:O-antigen ligase domain-containing protein [Boseongicola sp.]